MHVLIAVDDSPESREAARIAYQWFGPEAEYRLVSVGHQVPIFVGGFGATAVPSSLEVEEQLDAAFAEADHAIAEAAAALPTAAETGVETGHTGREICEHAAAHGCDVIVVGSHDRSVWERLFEPSVGRYLIEHAPCPVLVVRNADD